jgi:hypothetical protein
VLYSVVWERRGLANAKSACGFSKEIDCESDGDGDEQEFEDAAATVGIHYECGFDPSAGQDGEHKSK